MAKSEEFISPTNLWGKPLPSSAAKPAKKEEKSTRMRDYEDDIDDDVDAELEEDSVDIDGTPIGDVEDDSAAYAEAAELENDDESDTEDDDETEYEPEEGDAVSESEDDAVATAVDSDEDPAPVETSTRAKNRKVTDVAAKKSGAEHIREEIARRQESGDSLRGVDIVAALAKKRVEVSAAQVSQLLKKAGVASGKRGRPAKTEEVEDKSRVAAKGKKISSEPTRVAPKRPAAIVTGGKSATMPMEQLKAASTFLDACDGCYDTAAEILAAHQQLGAMMSR